MREIRETGRLTTIPSTKADSRRKSSLMRVNRWQMCQFDCNIFQMDLIQNCISYNKISCNNGRRKGTKNLLRRANRSPWRIAQYPQALLQGSHQGKPSQYCLLLCQIFQEPPWSTKQQGKGSYWKTRLSSLIHLTHLYQYISNSKNLSIKLNDWSS